MKKIIYTKTSTFIFPLLNIPKDIFECDVRYPNGNTKYSTRFLNSYLKNSQILHYQENHVFIVVRNYRDQDFDLFYSTITSFENYVDDYEKDEFLILIFSIPEKNKEDYLTLLDGKYSKISQESKELIIKNFFFSGKPMVIPLILSKALALKKQWEETINGDIGDQDVWSKILIEKETLTDTKLLMYQKKSSIKISEEFE